MAPPKWRRRGASLTEAGSQPVVFDGLELMHALALKIKPFTERHLDDGVVMTRPAIHTASIEYFAFIAFRFVLHAEPVTASTAHIPSCSWSGPFQKWCSDL